MIGQMRRSGLDAIGELAWGTHICQFYQTPQDLLEVLVGYFQQGLQNNEFCMWVTSEPLGIDEATNALRSVVPDLDERIRQGQIEFLDYRQWYFPDDQFDADLVLQRWVGREHAALTLGYEGLRFSGNITWVGTSGWNAFSDYEATVNEVIGSRHILALCTYPLDKCGGVEMLEVLRNHPLALVEKEGKWEVIQSPQDRNTTQALHNSEQRQKAILNTIPDPAWLKDKEERFLAVNTAWCRFSGSNSNDVLGKTVFDVFPTEIARKLSEEDRDIVQSCRPLQLEQLLPDKDGRLVWFDTIRNPLFNDHGDVVGTTGIARDITARKHAEELLREKEERLRLAAQAADFGTYDYDLVANKLYWSPELKAIWGLRPDDPCPVAENHVHLGVHPDDRAKVGNSLKGSLNPQGSGLLRIEHRIVRPDGSVRWVLAHGRVYFSGNGETRHACPCCRNLSGHHRAESSRRSLTRQRGESAGSPGSGVPGLLCC